VSELCLALSAFAGGMLGERIFFDRFEGCEPIGVALFRQPADSGWVSMGLLVRLFGMCRWPHE